MSEENEKQITNLSVVTLYGFYAGSPNCSECGAPPSEHEVRNYNEMFRDGDVRCKKCGAYVRDYDAG